MITLRIVLLIPEFRPPQDDDSHQIAQASEGNDEGRNNTLKDPFPIVQNLEKEKEKK